MKMYNEFFLEFMHPFFDSLTSIVISIATGVFDILNIFKYIDIIKDYSSLFQGAGIFVLTFSIIILIVIYAIVIYFIYLTIIRYVNYSESKINQKTMKEEINRLNLEISRLQKDNHKLKKMYNHDEVEIDEEGNVSNVLTETDSRFPKLSVIDSKMSYIEKEVYNKEICLEDFCNNFRNFSASNQKLYFDIKVIRLFVASLASNRLILLDGSVGSGKTNLVYAFGQMIDNKITVVNVKPNWNDSSEVFGYYNEFTKKYNETEVLEKLYEATYIEDVYITLFDEMNISRVEHYFAEMLSILELPNKKDWVLNLMPSGISNDPAHISKGRLRIPLNTWYIGTINHDESTYEVSDKVYDRAFSLVINNNSKRFEAPKTEPMRLSSLYLIDLFSKAQEKRKLNEDTLNKLDDLCRYVDDHFSISIGNRFINQVRNFVPVYIECGGTGIDGIDYLIVNRILVKVETVDKNLLKKEIDSLDAFISKLFEGVTLQATKEYLEMLKKKM